MKLFLDANIIIDFLDKRRKNNRITKDFLALAVENEYELIISEDVLTNVFYICRKDVDRKNLLDFLLLFSREFSISSFGEDVIVKSINLCQKNKKMDLEDVLQSVFADKENCDLIISNDKKFSKLNVDIISVKDFIKKF